MILFDLKWRLLPGILGIATLGALLVGVSLVATQTTYALGESGPLFCQNSKSGRTSTGLVQFDATNPCADLNVQVSHEHRYLIRLTEVKNWADGANPAAFPWTSKSYPATPENGVLAPTGLLAATWPFARVTSANFLEPLTYVRSTEVSSLWTGFVWLAFGSDIDIRKTEFLPADGAYEMAFCPKIDGRLHFMLNDTGLTYANNTGTATIEVIDLGPRDVDAKCPPWR